MSKTLLEKFYAVTTFAETKTKSAYEAKIGGEGEKPILTKIMLEGESKIKVGGQIKNGTMIAVTKCLELFIPEGSGVISPTSTIQRDIVMVNTRYHGGGTSPIVALFLEKEEVLHCFEQQNLNYCDQRWIESTIKTLWAIGTDNQYCAISVADARWWLIPPSQWQKT